MIKILYTALLADGGILFFDEDFGNAIFCCDEMGGLSVNVDNINLDSTNYDEDDSDTIIHVRLLAWHSKFQKGKTC